MEIALQSTPFFQAVEYLAIFCCGMGGGLTAVRKRYDVSSIIIIAWLTALGGGIVRDILLGALLPVGISDMGSVLTAFAAGAVVAVVHPEVNKLKWSMITIDALALGLFAVNGTSKALLYNTSGMTAVFLGTFPAMGDGVIRDSLVNEVPMVIRDPHFYIVPAVLGSIFTVWVWRAHTAHRIGDATEMILDIGIVLVVILLRLCSVKFNIQVPGAVRRQRVHLPKKVLNRMPNDDSDDDFDPLLVPQPVAAQRAEEQPKSSDSTAHDSIRTHGKANTQNNKHTE